MSQVLRLAPRQDSSADQGESMSPALHEESHHLWIGQSNFFSTSLLVLPSGKGRTEEGEGESPAASLFTATAEFYDPDGYLFNECGIACPEDRALRLSLQSFMESCKLESGWKHAHLCIRTKARARFVCEFFDKTRTTFYSPATTQPFSSAHAFPVAITSARRNLFALVSGEEIEQRVKLRLFIGNRKPECDVTISPMGVRLVSLEDLFPDFCRAAHDEKGEDGGSAERMQAYLRVSTSKPGSLSVYSLQQNICRGGGQAFSCGVSL